jgi:hypothetical protein
MTTLTIASNENVLPRVSSRWIISQRTDLLWFIGGALAGYGLFVLHAGLHLDMVTIWFLWVVFIDSPHFFGTYVRTYFDRQEFQARRRLLIGSLGWLAVGPTILGLSYLLHQAGSAAYRVPFLAFIVVFNLWAYWHVVRQHWGIMALYRRKNQDFALWDTRLDQALIYVGLLAPFTAFLVRHPEARKALGLAPEFPVWPAGVTQLEALMPTGNRPWHWEHAVVAMSVAAVTIVVAGFVVRQFWRWRSRLPLNLPKLLFVAALIPLYSYICYSSAVITAPLLAFSAFVTIYHDVQYHAIVYFYSRNRYHRPGVDARSFGLAPWLTRNFAVYLLAGIVMAGLFRLFGCSFELHPGCFPLVLTSEQTLFGSITTRELLLSLLLGVPMHHYFVDQFIWRPSRDEGLRSDLQMARA